MTTNETITEDVIDRINKYFAENNFHETADTYTGEEVVIEIHWGDWKHEHLRATFLMGKLGFVQYDEYVTEEDGSDCYSANHFYRLAFPCLLK